MEEIARGRMILPAMGRGLLNPAYIDNLVDGISLAAGRDEGAGQVFTISDGIGVPHARVLRPLRASSPGASCAWRPPRWSVRWPPSGASCRVTPGRSTAAAIEYIARGGTYSIDKARRVLGYKPAVKFEEGMRRTTEWLRAEGYGS